LPFTTSNPTLLCVHMFNDMNFDFHLKGVPIKASEATALLSATGMDPIQGLRIDLEKILDMRKINSKMLFDLSVSEGNQELASLAWRISMGRTEKFEAAPQRRAAPRQMRTPYTEQTFSLEQIIDKINRSDAYWAAGASLIISRTSLTDWTTLRRIATEFINECWDNRSLPNKSAAYRGFMLADDGSLRPRDLTKGVVRKETFHVSPLYIGLREGLIFCQKQNLIEMKSAVSIGSENPNTSPRAKDMRRVFYKIRASEKGAALADLWSDCDVFAKMLFEKRIEH